MHGFLPSSFSLFWVRSPSSFFFFRAYTKTHKRIALLFPFLSSFLSLSSLSLLVSQLSRGLILDEASLTEMRGSVSRANRFLLLFLFSLFILFLFCLFAFPLL